MSETITIKSICTVCGEFYMQTRHPMLGLPGPCPECKEKYPAWKCSESCRPEGRWIQKFCVSCYASHPEPCPITGAPCDEVRESCNEGKYCWLKG